MKVGDNYKMRNDNVTLLDCTLRDGGYITNWYFGSQVIREIIQNMVDANLDYRSWVFE